MGIRVGALWFGAAAGWVLGGGCASPQPSLPETPAVLEVSVISPADGDSVAGEVRLRASLRGNVPVSGVSFLRDGVPLDTLASPPWEALWSVDAPPGGARRVLTVRAWTATGWTVSSRAVTVRALPDAAPVIRWRDSTLTVWMDRSSGAVLRAEAWDPEDGPLDPQGLVWTGDHLARPLRGPALPLAILAECDQCLWVTAADRWGRESTRQRRVRPFTYGWPASPEICLQNLAAALQARGPEAWEEQTDSGFVFVPCPREAEAAGWPAVWRRPETARRIRGWITDPQVGELEWIWRIPAARYWSDGVRTLAWLEGAGLQVRFRDDRKQALITLPDEAADLLLQREGGTGWRLREWRDLPGTGPQSLASILAARDGLPAAPATARCRP